MTPVLEQFCARTREESSPLCKWGHQEETDLLESKEIVMGSWLETKDLDCWDSFVCSFVHSFVHSLNSLSTTVLVAGHIQTNVTEPWPQDEQSAEKTGRRKPEHSDECFSTLSNKGLRGWLSKHSRISGEVTFEGDFQSRMVGGLGTLLRAAPAL